MSAPDPHLDAQLRDVPLPDGFVDRLKAALLPSDEQLDAALAAVAVPSTVLARLKEIPSDIEVDESLADVVSPPALIYSLRHPTWGDRLRRSGQQLQRLAVAALLFVALSTALAASLRAIISGTLNLDAYQPRIVMIYDGPPSLNVSQAQLEAPPVDLATALQPSDLSPIAEQPADSTPPIARVSLPEIAGQSSAGPVGEWARVMSSGLRPLDDAVLLRYGVLGSSHSADDYLPDLIAPRVPRAAGIEPPRVQGYDRPFFLKHRVFPPLVPAANSRLADLDVPLVAGSDALSRIERTLAESRVPEPNDIRVEDLIAAMDYRFAAAPAGQLALRTAAGPALFGPAESGLLLVGVQAGGLKSRRQAATHLVIALDLSHSMTRGGRLEIVQQSLSRLLEQLEERDRLSLVVFNEDVTHVVEAAARDDAASIRQLLGGLAPRGGTNLAAGLQQAASLAMSDAAGSGAARRLILVTDSQATMPDDTRAGVEQVLEAAGAVGVRLDVIDLSQRSQSDSVLTAWAAGLHGDLRPANDARQMNRVLLEALSAQQGTVARDARLKLHFNPQAVAAYRLVGHEANPLADLTPVALETELSAGEAAAALVEIWFQPGDANDLGYAELTWRDPETGRAQRRRQPISRLQFAPSRSEAPLALVQAALAAETGEVLRESHEALRQAGVRPAANRGLTAVLVAADEVQPQIRQRADVQRLLQVVRELKRQGVR